MIRFIKLYFEGGVTIVIANQFDIEYFVSSHAGHEYALRICFCDYKHIRYTIATYSIYRG